MIAFCGAQIIAGDEMAALTGACLTVRGERILAIGDALPGADRIDLPGALICPMFVDAHTHLGDAGAKELGIGLSLEQAVHPPDGLKHRYLASLDAETLVRTMRCGLLDMLHSGVIACGDFREQGLAGVRSLRRAAAGLPVRVVILGRMAELEQADAEAMEREAEAILAEADGLGVRDVEAYPPDLLSRLRRRYPGKIFAVHAAESSAAQADSLHRTGRTQVARALDWQPDLLVHLVHATPEDLHAVARAGVTAVSCPRCNGVLGNGFPDLAAWRAAGVRLALGTDNVMFVAPDMLRELDFASRLGRGLAADPRALDARELLQAATLNGARGLKLDADLGSLAPGKEASFLLFDLDRPHLRYQHDPISAIVHRAGRADIAAIYVRGQLVGY
ncbi:MAG: amidohydrolase family protein [Caldilineales bacterium]|nr:amidohydrolase family protein [Caldilineales bacterium]